SYATAARERGLKVIIAGAGGAAHLPGMTASMTELPVLGVPIESKALKGLDSLLSIAQMPAGVPVGTLAIGEAGARNAALLAIAILANSRPDLRKKLHSFRSKQTKPVVKQFAKELKKQADDPHALAQDLWETGNFEARAVASWIDDPKQVTKTQMDAWAKDFDNWATVDGTCCYLFC